MSDLPRLGLEPIPGDSPTGADIRYDDAFTAIETEVAKLDNPGGGEVDWRMVLTGGQELLETKAKHLLVAAWCARAAFDSQRLPGLAAGLTLIGNLLETWWEGCFPPVNRIKARRAALEWLSEKTAPLVEAHDAASPQGRDALELCRQQIERIGGFVQPHFEGEDSGLMTLRRRLAEFTSGSAPAAEGGSSEGGAPAASGGGFSAPVHSGPIASRAEAIQRLSEIADFFARTEPHSPIGFLVGRAVAWSGKSFQEVFVELLKNKSDAQEQLWDSLGLQPPQPPSSG